MIRIAAIALFSVLSLQVAHAANGNKLALCVYDPLSQAGDIYRYAKDYVLQMPRFGIMNPFELKAYNDETVLVNAFRSGQCDAALMTTLRSREFNKYTASLEAIGGTTSKEDINLALQVLSSKQLAPKMSQGDYEVIGLVPLGTVYLMVDNRNINSVQKAMGKKIAVLDYDSSQALMVKKFGGKPVTTDLMSVGTKFINHQVNIMLGPAVMVRPFELAKGMTNANGVVQGAIVRVPVLQFTATMLVHKSKFSNPEANQKIREYVYSQLGTAYKYIDSAEKTIDPKLWMDIAPADKQAFLNLMHDIRIELTKNGVYDKDMMHMLKNVRCKTDPGRSECLSKDE